MKEIGVLPSLKPHFSRSLRDAEGRIHLAAHSHHLWPDASWEGQRAAWDDAARLWDGKWQRVFGTVIPAAQRHVARVLNLPDPGSVAFAPNTHEFVRRLLSACPPQPPTRILTTDGEFHSFARQVARLEQDGLALVERVAVQPFATFSDRFATAAARGGHHLVFLSQVFFGSGLVVTGLERIVRAVPDRETLVAIDGYHGFMARPTDLAPIAERAFYMAGGYKYAMSGEGCCFLHCPPGAAPRPRDTGWYAAFGALSGTTTGVAYGADGSRFMGASFDPSGLYRFVAVMDWLQQAGIDVAAIHAHVAALQQAFVPALDTRAIPGLRAADLLVRNEPRGNFLAYASPHAADLHAALTAAGIVTDRRGDVLRIGFGAYHELDDTPKLVARIAAAVTPPRARATARLAAAD